MSWDAALRVTAATVSMPNLRLAPAPSVEDAASGTYDLLGRGLAGILGRSDADANAASVALRETKRWATSEPARECIRGELKLYHGESIFHERWLDEHIRHEWLEHAARLGGLFDHAFLPELACLLDVQESELLKVLKLTQDHSLLNNYIRKRPQDEAFAIMVNAFIASTLLRGRYHDHEANERQAQIMHHDIRQRVLPQLESEERKTVAPNNTERYFANILLAGAFEESKPESRILLWLENVRNARIAVLSGYNLSSASSDSVALDKAVDAARKHDIRTHSKTLEMVLQVSASFGLGALARAATPQFAVPELDLAIRGGVMLFTSFATYKSRPGQRISRATMNRPSRLKKLATMGPGRVHSFGPIS
jgi:hypothetical protein